MKYVMVVLLAAMGMSAAPASRTFTGTISDDMCALAGHSRMQMGPTDADCTRACIMSHGANYVLSVGKTFYVLSDQETPERLAAQKVRVVGQLDAKTKTIKVESITAVK